MVKAKKRKQLLVYLYPSGIEGKGKKQIRIVTSVLTPKQYIRRFYSSSYHSRTEYAIKVKPYHKNGKHKMKKLTRKQAMSSLTKRYKYRYK